MRAIPRKSKTQKPSESSARPQPKTAEVNVVEFIRAERENQIQAIIRTVLKPTAKK